MTTHEKYLMTAHESFNDMQAGMVDTNGKDIWLRDLDAREVFPLSMEFLGLARYQAIT